MQQQQQRHRKTFGLKKDPLAQLALLFSALIHDVEHKGVSNRQLVLESEDLALLYNDQSVAEQRSLAVAFAELNQNVYEPLRHVLFPEPDDYRRFRKIVINLVLSTDIASPERTQLVKSKWKEAFGDTQEALARKQQKQQLQQQKQQQQQQQQQQEDMSRRSVFQNRGPGRMTTSSASAGSSIPHRYQRGSHNSRQPGHSYSSNRSNHHQQLQHLHQHQEHHGGLPQSAQDHSNTSMPRSILGSTRSKIRRPSANSYNNMSYNSQFSELTMDPSLRYLASQMSHRNNNANNNNANNGTHDDNRPTDILEDDPQDSSYITSNNKGCGHNDTFRANIQLSDGEQSTSVTPDSHDGLEPWDADDDDEDPLDGVIQSGTTLSASSKADPQTIKALKRGNRALSLQPTPSAPMTSMDKRLLHKELSLKWPILDKKNEDGNGRGILPRQMGYYRRAVSGGVNWDAATVPATNVGDNHGSSHTHSTAVGQHNLSMNGNNTNHTTNNMNGQEQYTRPTHRQTRRFSVPPGGKTVLKAKMRGFSLRLGIRRSMDLTGEAIEHFSQVSSRSSGSSPSRGGASRRSSHSKRGSYVRKKGSSSVHSPKSHHHHHHRRSTDFHDDDSDSDGSSVGSDSDEDDDDDDDELRATVVLEHMIKAADVAPNMQGWQHMQKWSTRLFFELLTAHANGRGEDPQPRWFENQISFLESYTVPLARRLDDTGVFGRPLFFGAIVEENADRWIADGNALTSHIIHCWKSGDVNQDPRTVRSLEEGQH